MIPTIDSFSDGDIAIGEQNVVVGGRDFGSLQGLGSILILDDPVIASATNVDTITTLDAWAGTELTFDMPGSMNNTPGTRWAVVFNDEGNPSPSFSFTLSAAAAGGVLSRGTVGISTGVSISL